MIISVIWQSDSAIHAHLLFHILLHYGLSEDIEYSALCSTDGPCCLLILYTIVWTEVLLECKSAQAISQLCMTQ